MRRYGCWQFPGWVGQINDCKVAANALSNVSANAYTKASIERLLRQELQIASVFLVRPVIGSVDLRQWGVREAAYVLAKRLADTYSSHSFEESDSRLQFSSIEKALIDSLDEALQEFVDELEPQALKIASASGQFNQRLYNYLAHKSHRRFRLQLAETFPSLLVTSALARRDTLGAELRSIVDSGTPLIKGLAGRWNVRPGVVRHLVGKPTGHVGIQWSRDAMGLAQALNALRPEDVPGDEADAWREFNHMVAVGQRLFCPTNLGIGRGPGVAKRVCEPSQTGNEKGTGTLAAKLGRGNEYCSIQGCFDQQSKTRFGRCRSAPGR